MSLLLDVLYVVLLLVCSPMLAYRAFRTGKYREGWAAKFWGEVPRRLGDRPCLWFHAVSVGEVKLLKPLIEEISRRRPDWEIRISTTTKTGLDVARQNYPELVTFYAPLDFSWSVHQAMARVRPTILALVELELWPNLIRSAKAAGVQVAVVNGRLSSRSHRGYRWIRSALAGTLRSLDLVAVQTEEYGRRFMDLGTPHDRIRVTGSVKYDDLEADRSNSRTQALRRSLGLSASELVFVAGSTMEGEEAAALEAFRAARAENPQLRLILVPRHPERFDTVAAWLDRESEPFVRRSSGVGSAAGAPGRACPPGRPIVLVDTIGELSAVWGLADLAFVGGSLFPGRGGQNMMEPAAYGAAVFFGSYTENFRDAVEGLLGCRGAVRVRTPSDLTAGVIDALRDPEAATIRGAAGRQFVLAQQGAAVRTAAELERLASGQTLLQMLAA
jgi:3-deoxy-D-manno-octulosonic-acid transferase